MKGGDQENIIGGVIPSQHFEKKKRRGQDFIDNIDQNSMWPGILKTMKAHSNF